MEVFGDTIHTYDIRQSQKDKSTVPIYYEPRQVRLHLTRKDLDRALADISTGIPEDELERKKSQWSTIAKAAGAKDRLKDLAVDLVEHFNERTSVIDGKAVVVCMIRENCVKLYDELTVLPGCPEVKVVISGNVAKDPVEWNKAGHITTKDERDAIKKRMKDVNDPLKIAIVCDMWLTGTDIPCLHTMYIDKPMRGHSIIQAISRVNRVFRDKPHGLIVDYIGVGDELREATATYTQGGGRGSPAPNVTKEAVPIFKEKLQQIRELIPREREYLQWRNMDSVEREDLFAYVYGILTVTDEKRDEFLEAELQLFKVFTLVKHLDECRPYADEVLFYQTVRKQLNKTKSSPKPEKEIAKAIQDLVDESIESEGVHDIFKAAGIDTPDISILDEKFLETYKDRPNENLRVKLLAKLLADQIILRRRRNVAQSRSFRQLLEETLQKYHNRLIGAAEVIRVMVGIQMEMRQSEERAQQLGLTEEELAFYDAVAIEEEKVYDEPFLCDLIHDVVQTIRKNLKVDWTKPHREDVRAEIRATVKLVLRRHDVSTEDFDVFFLKFMEQAEQMYVDWPVMEVIGEPSDEYVRPFAFTSPD